MTIKPIDTNGVVSGSSHGPQFEHELGPRFVLFAVAVTVLLFLAFFAYGQLAPGS